MRIRKCLSLALAAALTAVMLTGCPWDAGDETGGDSSGSSSSSSSGSRPGYDEDEWGQPEMYTVTVEAGPNGTAAVSTNRVEEGGLVFITAHPDAGYEVEAVTANGKPLTASREGIYAIFNITENQNITVTFAKKGIVTAEDRALVRQKLDELLESEELQGYEIQPFALNDKDAAFLEDWYRENGYKDALSEPLSEAEAAAEAEAHFGVNFYAADPTTDRFLWEAEDQKAWMLYETDGISYQMWEEGTIDRVMIWDTVLKNILTHRYEDGNLVPLSGDFSIAFVIAEDQEEQEVHVLWIIQRVPEHAALVK